jgi:hypothetical protein
VAIGPEQKAVGAFAVNGSVDVGAQAHCGTDRDEALRGSWCAAFATRLSSNFSIKSAQCQLTATIVIPSMSEEYHLGAFASKQFRLSLVDERQESAGQD